MKPRRKTAPKACPLPADLTIRSALEVQALLMEAVGSGCTVFDAAGVEAVDSAGIQLLVALERSVGEGFCLQALSAPLRQARALYGMDASVEKVAQ